MWLNTLRSTCIYMTSFLTKISRPTHFHEKNYVFFFLCIRVTFASIYNCALFKKKTVCNDISLLNDSCSG